MTHCAFSVAISFAMAVWFGFWLPVSNIPLATGTIFGERLFYAPSLAVALDVGGEFGPLGPGADQRHLATQHVAQLGQLVKTRLAEPPQAVDDAVVVGS